jgi:hypothetical protein
MAQSEHAFRTSCRCDAEFPIIDYGKRSCFPGAVLSYKYCKRTGFQFLRLDE